MTNDARPIITLTTDFGLVDSYVASMKGVILGICPDAALIDVSHDVPPQDVVAAAHLLDSVWPYFTRETIHLAVVDPGVGTARRAVAIRAPHGTFVGPDNGLFGPTLVRQRVLDEATGRIDGATVVELTAMAFQRPEVSHTFHGRDVFAPVAAHLANGVSLETLGEPIQALTLRRTPRAEERDGVVEGVVSRIDRFGNLITNIPASLLPTQLFVEVGTASVPGLASSYQEGEIVALIGSHGFLEVAARSDSASRRLGVSTGDAVRVRGR